MPALEQLLAFRPTRLAQARVVIAESHPTVRQLADGVPPDTSALRERIGEAAGSSTALRALAFQLSSRELVFAARSMGDWREVREAIAAILEARPSAQVVPALWRAWESYPRADLVRTTLMSMLGHFGAESLGHPAEHNRLISRWFSSADVLAPIVSWMDESRLSPRELSGISDSPFRSDTPLIGYIEEGVLTLGSSRQLLSLGAARIEEAWRELRPETQVEACRHYLDAVGHEEWSGDLLEHIRDAYGMPDLEGSLGRFWGGVSGEDRKAFRRHFISADLAAAFEGDTERHAYWARWADRDEILEVRQGQAKNVPWARMTFRGFAVVEFFVVGNAAYFLPADAVRRVPWDKARNVAQLKHRIRNPVPGHGDNRLNHFRGWQEKADRMMKAWIRKYS